MSTQFGKLFQAILFFYVVIFIGIGVAKAEASPAIILDDSVTKVDVYPGLDMIKGKKNELTIEDMSLENVVNKFVPSTEIERKRGFFERENWIRFEVVNQSNHDEWILEFAFPLIHELDLYVKEGDEFVHFYKTGADFPFHQREMNHRYFAFNLDIEPGETMTFYGLAVGSGDLHPPVYIWEKNSFLEKTQTEFVLLGIFYGIVLVMIVYNLYLFISLRLKSYIYYVLVIIFTLFGKLSINGLGFQYIWSNYPNWNVISTPFWVTIACICIVFFTREFLNLDRYIPSIKYFFLLINTIKCNNYHHVTNLSIYCPNFNGHEFLYNLCYSINYGDYLFETRCPSSEILYIRVAYLFNRCVYHYFRKNVDDSLYDIYRICWPSFTIYRSCSFIFGFSRQH